MNEMRNAYKISVGKPEGKRPLRRPRCRWDTMDLIREIGLEVVYFIHLAQDMNQWRPVVNTVMNLGFS
jgi:hypothetical protein